MLEGTTFLRAETEDDNIVLQFEVPRDWLSKTMHKMILNNDERFVELEELVTEGCIEGYAETCYYSDARLFYELAMSDNIIISTENIKLLNIIKRRNINMNLTKKEDIIKDGTKVLTNGFIAIIRGNDSEECEVTENGEYIDVNYYVIPLGKTFNEEHMSLDDEFYILDSKKVCPNCGKVIEEELEIHNDELGIHSNCPKCGASADLEMFYEHQDR